MLSPKPADSPRPPTAEPGTLRPMRKFFACDECKRRKIRCSGGDRCANCERDAKGCHYSSPSQRLVALQRRLQETESVRRRMEQAWAVYLPGVNLAAALRSLPKSAHDPDETDLTPLPHHDHDASTPYRRATATATAATVTVTTAAATVDDDATEPMPPPPTEHLDADDLEFDESEDPERAIDGMAFLTAGPHKSGYTGPQSGIAALKFLQSLPPYLPVTYNASPLAGLLNDEVPDAATHREAARARYIDYYFELYHPAYPILHEGTFRARVAGALAKPRDGSWPLLYHTVLAIGAFVSGGTYSDCSKDDDLSFFREARRHLGMSVLEKGSLGYVQALTLLANYLQKRNKPNTGFILIGTAFSMAVAIGLHREFGMPRTSPFTMELRRRTWWTLFVFLSGAQLALGRPAASSAEVSVRLPANLDDAELAVDMDQLPPERAGPTVASCLIEQVRLARIANAAQAELAAHRRPHAATTARLEERIRLWRSSCPAFFAEDAVLEPHLECPKRVLVWRGLNLRIVLNRPFLFEAIAAGAQLPLTADHLGHHDKHSRDDRDDRDYPVRSCLMAADECAASICAFLRSLHVVYRGFAWYTTAWLMTASFVQATCLIYMPGHALAAGWRASLHEAAECLRTLGASVDIALRARDILQNVLDNRVVNSVSPSTAMYRPQAGPVRASPGASDMGPPSTDTLAGMGFEDSFAWFAQGQEGAEFLGAAGGFVYGNGFDLL